MFNNNRIREVSNGTITTVAGNGAFGFSGDNGPATSAELYSPGGVAVDSAGNLYIADTQNTRIREVSKGVITTVAGGGNSFDNGPATSAALGSPKGVAVDAAGNIYIADQIINRIREVSKGVITTVAGNGIGGLYGGFSGDGGPATSAQLSLPTSVAVDSADNVYIADTNNNRIRKVSNGVITTVAGNGTRGFSGDGGPATNAELADPEGVAVDAAGNLYIADSFNNRIRKVTNGVITTVAGNGTGGFSGDNGPATGAELTFPESVAIDSAGNLYIADIDNNRIRILTVAPPPTISKVTNAASYATGAVSPGEIISIFANASNPIGPTPYVQLSSANCPSPCANVPTTMGGVQVVFLPQEILAPLL